MSIDVLIGGESVGIILNYDGVCITGFYKIKVDNEIIDPSNYFEINDIITSVDKKNVKTIDDLKNERLCAQIGTTGALKAQEISGNVGAFNTEPEAFMELKEKVMPVL